MIAGLLLLFSALAPKASAELVESGKTRLRLDRGLFNELKREGVKVAKVKQGKVQGRLVTLPVKGGLIEPASGSGWVDGAGGLSLRAGKRVVRLTEITVNTAKQGVWAKLDGKRAKIAAVEGPGFSRTAFGGTIRIGSLKLNVLTAGHLNRRLGLDGVFGPGQPFAAVSSTYRPEWVQVAKGSLQLSFDQAFLDKLKSVEIEPRPFEMSVAGPNPLTYSAPLLGGAIYPTQSRSAGFVEGGFRLAKPEAPGPVITVGNLQLSQETSSFSNAFHLHTEAGQLGTVPPPPFATVDLGGAGLQPAFPTRSLTISNARVVLAAAGADLINEAFAKPKGKDPIVAAGDPLGTASATLQGR